MELNKVENLLEKYEEGNTTLIEEKQLQEFFASEEVPVHLIDYQMIFAYSSKTRATLLPDKQKVKPKRWQYAYTGIAAGILLAVGIFAYENNRQAETSQNLGTIEDTEEAYQKTKETLQLVAEVLNTGREELEYLNEFNNTKDKFITD